MSNKRALVTGASRGIGKAIAQRLAKDGFRVIGTATSERGAAGIEKDLKAISADAQGMVLDLGDEQSINQCVNDLKESDRLPSVFVANAGITQDNLMLRMSVEAWNKVLNVNLTGTFLLCRQLMRPMMKDKWGRVILLGSVVGSMGNVGQANYAAAKAGVAALGRSLAHEFASRNITVNTIAPGFIKTDMTDALDESIRSNILKHIPLHRYGTPDEIAGVASFLASEDGGYMTGQILHVNGGIYMI